MSRPFEVLATGFGFAEAPRHAPDGSLFFSELVDGGLFRLAPDGSLTQVLPERRWIGGIVINRDGRLLCSGEGGLVRFDPRSSRTEELLSEIDGTPIIAVNDIEAGRDGGLYGGTVDFNAILDHPGEQPLPGTFFHLRPDGELVVIRSDLLASNGMGFSPDGRRLYHSETPKGIWVYELADDGLPGDQKLFAQVEDGDGLVVDAGEHVWVARWNSGEIIRYRPDGGIAEVVRLPFPHVVSLDFGGSDLCELVVSTGGTDPATGGKIGGLVRIRTETPGQPSFQAGF